MESGISSFLDMLPCCMGPSQTTQTTSSKQKNKESIPTEVHLVPQRTLSNKKGFSSTGSMSTSKSSKKGNTENNLNSPNVDSHVRKDGSSNHSRSFHTSASGDTSSNIDNNGAYCGAPFDGSTITGSGEFDSLNTEMFNILTKESFPVPYMALTGNGGAAMPIVRNFKTKYETGPNNELHDICEKMLWEDFDLKNTKRTFLYEHNLSGLTPLGLACKKNAPLSVIQELIKIGPKACEFFDNSGDYPLHHYCKNGTSVKALKLILEEYPEACQERNRYGSSPLQLSLDRSNLSEEWYYEIIKVCPSVASYHNRVKELPMHYCGKVNLNVESLRLMLDAYPIAIRSLNRHDSPPVLLACNRGASFDVIKTLVEYCPSMVKVKDHAGNDCINALWNVHLKERNVLPKLLQRERKRVEMNKKALWKLTSHKQLKGRQKEWWSKIELVLNVLQRNLSYSHHVDSSSSASNSSRQHQYDNSSEHTFSHGELKCLHVIASHSTCPVEMVDLAIRLYKHQVEEKDDYGRLPIHYAAMNYSIPVTNSEETDAKKLNDINEGDEEEEETVNNNVSIEQSINSHDLSQNILAKFVQVSKDSVKTLDSYGRLPLHYAIESGKTWFDDSHHNNGDMGGSPSPPSGTGAAIKLLVEAAPETLSIPDSKTGLYPFMSMLLMCGSSENSSSASCSSIDQRRKNAELFLKKTIPGWNRLCKISRVTQIQLKESHMKLDSFSTVYEMLRANPDIINVGTGKEDIEVSRLRRHNKYLREEQRSLRDELRGIFYGMKEEDKVFMERKRELVKEISDLRSKLKKTSAVDERMGNDSQNIMSRSNSKSSSASLSRRMSSAEMRNITVSAMKPPLLTKLSLGGQVTFNQNSPIVTEYSIVSSLGGFDGQEQRSEMDDSVKKDPAEGEDSRE